MTHSRTARKAAMPRSLTLIALASLGAMIASPALAQDNSYGYMGLAAGTSRSRLDDQRTANTALGGGGSAVNLVRDRNHLGYRLFGGMQMNRYLGIEAGFFDLGNFSFDADTGTPGGRIAGTLKVQGANLDVVGTFPLSERFSMLARAGATYTKSRGSFESTAALANPRPSNREGNWKAGVGLQYAFSPSFLLRGEVERYRVSDAVGHRGNVDMMNVSLVFPFGRGAAPARQAMAMRPMAMPAMPVVEPMITPVPVREAVVAVAPAPTVVAPTRRRVSYSAESMFGFDLSGLQPEGMRQLDAFAHDVEGSTFEIIMVEGHTDRLGTTTYNQALSERRAQAVKDYLVSSGKLDPAKVTIAGKSESQPITKPGDCVGERRTPALVNCLAPDRRVEIEVVGTR